MKKIKSTNDRFERTLAFVEKHISKDAQILDLGTENQLSNVLRKAGYGLSNTEGENLDTDFHKYIDTGADVVTAFEIFEHMFAPFNILSSLKTERLIASIPMKLWFSSAYWNEQDDWDKHYHEFEKKQFDFLLEKSGWKIIDSELWKSYTPGKLGIRPLLRRTVPRYYIVYCERT